ncbi:family 1 glycosylhydrolase, partial [Enterococcus faecalis]
AKGYYPAHKLKEFEREGMTIQMESEDLAIIQKGTVDYIGFSYYMSTVSTAYPEEVKYVGGNQMPAVKNPYLQESE